MRRREELETLLRQRGWGGTLPGSAAGAAGLAGAPAASSPPLSLERPATAGVAFPIEAPAGAITELVPDAEAAHGGGVTSVALGLSAQAECLAWLDPLDRLDPAGAEQAGIDLRRLLWLRGGPELAGMPGLSRWNDILLTLLQSEGMDLLVADFLDWPVTELRRMPRSAWFRLLRSLERWRRTALVVLAPEPLAPSSCAAQVLSCATNCLRPAAISLARPLFPTARVEAQIEVRMLRRRAGAVPRLGPERAAEPKPLRGKRRA